MDNGVDSLYYGLKGIRLPKQNDDIVRKLGYRWLRAVEPHNKWATVAKKCVEMLEGNQWTEEEKAALRAMRRTALTLNQIAPLWRLVMGYQSSNRMDTAFQPTSDSASSEDVANVLNGVFKAEAGRIGLKYTDSDVFADGISTGRGWWNAKLCFKDNDLGELSVDAKDPFSIFVDPDCQHYDINHDEYGAGYMQETVWTNLDSINEKFGSEAALAVQNVFSPAYKSSMLSYLSEQEISPRRFFGGWADEKDYNNWADVYHNDFIDPVQKQIRLLDSQYKTTVIVPHFIDLETGDKEPIPDQWLGKPDIIDKVMLYCEKKGNPVRVDSRPTKKIRRTITCGDILIYDRWSIYKDYSLIGFFPYFRRGTTRGMIEDLIDPQREKNKKRSVITDIMNRNANSGWMWEENTLDQEQEENLRRFGSAPGINVKYKRGKDGQAEKPQRIEPGGYPAGLEKLEEMATNEIHDISGINQSAMGQLDNVQSGRAIEAKQRQAVMAIQLYSDNFTRSKEILGGKALYNFQKFYTEPRIYRILGEDSKQVTYEINKKQQLGDNAVNRLNDITVGKYSVVIDQVPISATFKQGQFEETMMILEKLGPIGQALAQVAPQLIIDQSSLPRKQEWGEALKQAAAMAPPAAGAPAGGGTPVGPAAGTPEMMPS